MKKKVLGMYVGENESAKYWLFILNGLKNRGTEDILITCIDGLTGFPEAISAVFPNDDSLMKKLYLAQSDITRKWTGRRKDRGGIHSQLDIYFAERLSE